MQGRLILAVAVVIAASRAVGWMAARARQPRVMGEILAGIMLGPSLLGWAWPVASSYVFGPVVVEQLGGIGQIGLVLFMFLVGMELDVEHLRHQGRKAVVISHASIVLPFGLGAALAVALHRRYGGDTDLLSFALFLGIAMSITAFPVLARVLQESGLDSTRLGAMALTCAAVDDVTAWCVLAVVVAVVESTGATDAVVTIALALAFAGAMSKVVRPLVARRGSVPLPVAVAFALLCAWLTELIGIHAIFGAFLAGTVMPRGEEREHLTERMQLVTTTVLLPMFFVVVGLSTRIGLVDSFERWLVVLLVVVVAVAGKLGGSAMAARLMGESRRDALALGVLMNTRGLTELVILTVGLQLGVLTRTMFTVLVIMALVTTLMAGPMLAALGVVAPRAGESRRRVRTLSPSRGPE